MSDYPELILTRSAEDDGRPGIGGGGIKSGCPEAFFARFRRAAANEEVRVDEGEAEVGLELEVGGGFVGLVPCGGSGARLDGGGRDDGGSGFDVRTEKNCLNLFIRLGKTGSHVLDLVKKCFLCFASITSFSKQKYTSIARVLRILPEL